MIDHVGIPIAVRDGNGWRGFKAQTTGGANASPPLPPPLWSMNTLLAERDTLRAVLIAMVRAYAIVTTTPGSVEVMTAGDSGALAVAFRALGMPDPCPLDRVPLS